MPLSLPKLPASSPNNPDTCHTPPLPPPPRLKPAFQDHQFLAHNRATSPQGSAPHGAALTALGAPSGQTVRPPQGPSGMPRSPAPRPEPGSPTAAGQRKDQHSRGSRPPTKPALSAHSSKSTSPNARPASGVSTQRTESPVFPWAPDSGEGRPKPPTATGLTGLCQSQKLDTHGAANHSGLC